MDASANNPSALAKTLALASVLIVVGAFVMASGPTPSSAAVQERILENGVRDNVPIKIKLKRKRKNRSKT